MLWLSRLVPDGPGPEDAFASGPFFPFPGSAFLTLASRVADAATWVDTEYVLIPTGDKWGFIHMKSTAGLSSDWTSVIHPLLPEPING